MTPLASLAVLSMHTSPLDQPGRGDSGGLNVYVRQLTAALARSGTRCDVYTRASSPAQPAMVDVEPGVVVHHVAAGPVAGMAKEDLPEVVGEFTSAVLDRMARGFPAQAIHANYWLSGVAGHALKHELELPLLTTFHTLAAVKAGGDLEPPGRRLAEAQVLGCSDAVLASCVVEAEQIGSVDGADPSRIEIVAPGVDRALFSPGDRAQARRAVGLPTGVPLLLFVGRIQPLKGVALAVRALAELSSLPDAVLVVVGGPSGADGQAEVDRVHALVAELGLGDRVHFVPPQPHHLLSSYYRAADLCLVPSRSESFGLVALEAAACGTPVVAAAVGGLLTLVDHGRTGFLVEGRDPADFAAYAAEVLHHPALAADLAARASARAGAYTWRRAGAAVQALGDRLTARSLVECR
ncbi:MAG TPA: glycosyltransferase [Acidimicrobiales bacterium]|nr:glycosyltransferase [Acidimicrobiales bacterium]